MPALLTACLPACMHACLPACVHATMLRLTLLPICHMTVDALCTKLLSYYDSITLNNDSACMPSVLTLSLVPVCCDCVRAIMLYKHTHTHRTQRCRERGMRKTA
jgi:hypothetical protein